MQIKSAHEWGTIKYIFYALIGYRDDDVYNF